jgi:hypothetical protein
VSVVAGRRYEEWIGQRWHDVRCVPLGISPHVHDRLVQCRRLLEGDVDAEVVAEPRGEELNFVNFGDGRISARAMYSLQ